MDSARASFRDGDTLCEVMQAIASCKSKHEEDGVYKALNASGLMVTVPMKCLDLGYSALKDFPCFNPRDLIQAAISRGQIHRVMGVSWDQRFLDGMSLHISFFTMPIQHDLQETL